MCRGTEAHQRGHVRYTQIRGAFEARAGVHKKTWRLGSCDFFLGVRGCLGWKVGAKGIHDFERLGLKVIHNMYGSLVRAYWGLIESYWKYLRVLVRKSHHYCPVSSTKKGPYNFEALDSNDSQWNPCGGDVIREVPVPKESSCSRLVIYSTPFLHKTLQGFLLAIAVRGFCGYMVVDTVPWSILNTKRGDTKPEKLGI